MTDPASLFAEQFAAATDMLAAGDAPWRQQAYDRFAATGLPRQQREAWRYTPLSEIAKAGYRLIPPSGAADTDIAAHKINGALHLVFIGGHFVPALSDDSEDIAGLAVSPISTLALETTEIGRPLGGETVDDALVALNQALFSDGVQLTVDAGVQITRPIQLLFIGAPSGMSHLRNFIALDEGAAATLVETYIGGGEHWTNVVNDLQIGAHASLTHLRMMGEAVAARHTARTFVSAAAHAHYDGFALLAGGALVRHETSLAITGARAECIMGGVSLGRGKELRDINTFIDHAVPDSVSNQQFRAVLDDAATSVFQGKVLVRPDAQHTDARQSSRNVLLSPTATANTKPELEIYADDVQCAHGATVGELDDDQLFYMRTRGIDERTAKQLLIEGFMADLVEGMANEDLKSYAQAQIAAWLSDGAAP